MSVALRWAAARPWIWALAGDALLFVALSSVTGRASLESLTGNASLAAFLAIVALGQMFAVSSGGGGIDLSIPYVLTLAAFICTGVTNGSDARLPLGVAAALTMGLSIGGMNALVILVLRIPPIIATMAVGFILNSAILLYQAGYSTFSISPFLLGLARNDLLRIPYILLFAAVLGGGCALLLGRTAYGRWLLAVGQNSAAAYLAGVPIARTVLAAYMCSGALASLGGCLIAARVGGAFLGMGDSYLLESVGAVVIGGTLIGGGRSTAAGTLFGALFLVLVVTLMEVTHLPIGAQNIVEGAIIILVLLAAGAGDRT